MATVHVEVVGRVQGVGFRWFVRERARRERLAGWVRNLETGGVEVAAAGPEDALDALMRDVRVGPPGAWVRELKPLPIDGLGELPNPFTILH